MIGKFVYILTRGFFFGDTPKVGGSGGLTVNLIFMPLESLSEELLSLPSTTAGISEKVDVESDETPSESKSSFDDICIASADPRTKIRKPVTSAKFAISLTILSSLLRQGITIKRVHRVGISSARRRN